MPAGVHLAVVDPEVGAVGAHARRAIAVRPAAAGQLLVGPDNGLLALALERLGGALRGRRDRPLRRAPGAGLGDLPRPRHLRPRRGRARRGAPLAGVGEPLAVEEPARAGAAPRGASASASCAYTHCNSTTSATSCSTPATSSSAQAGLRLGAELAVESPAGGIARATRRPSPTSRRRAAALRGRARMAALAVNRGSAARRWGSARDDELLVRPA